MLELVYGKFNICIAAADFWNDLDKNLKKHPPKSFKQELKLHVIQT